MSSSALSTMIDEHEIAASICRESFWDFTQEFWGEIIDEPLVPNWHMQYLCNVLQHVAERVFKRRPRLYDVLINIAPGTSKSTIASVMFPVWCWTRKSWIQTICGSYAQELSLDLSAKSRSIVQSRKFRLMFPNIKLREDQNTKTFFQNDKGGWRYATSTGGAVTGKHGHIFVIDDPVDPKGATSEAEIKAANDWLTNVVPKRRVDQTSSVAMMIMQRLSQDDPSSLWLSWIEKGIPIRHICLPADISHGSHDVKPQSLVAKYVDGLMDPKRLPREVLKNQELVGVYSYAGQYLQNPIPPGGGMFKVAKIVLERVDYSSAVGWTFVRYWDKAGTRGGGAYTVGALLAKDPNGFYWILDIVRGQWDPSERERIIKETAFKDGRHVRIVIEQEPGSSGLESVQSTIRNLAGFIASADRPTGDKTTRADPFAAQVNIANVKMIPAHWNKEYIEELAFFPESKYKDQVDASSGAFAWLARKKIKIGAL